MGKGGEGGGRTSASRGRRGEGGSTLGAATDVGVLLIAHLIDKMLIGAAQDFETHGAFHAISICFSSDLWLNK